MKKGFETFEHSADIGIRGFGPSIEDVFVQAAKAMFSYMYEIEKIQEISNCNTQEIEIHIREEDLVSMFIKWLNRLLSEADIHSLVFYDFKVKIEDNNLYGIAIGVPNKGFDVGCEVKGATYAEAKVLNKNGLWIGQCVIDV